MNKSLRELLYSNDEADRRLLADIRREIGDEALLAACVVEAALSVGRFQSSQMADTCDFGGEETSEEDLEARLHRVA